MRASKTMTNVARNFFRATDLTWGGERGIKIIEKTVEIVASKYLFVSRRYHPVYDGRVLKNLTYNDCWRIGPRGGIKIIYSNTSY